MKTITLYALARLRRHELKSTFVMHSYGNDLWGAFCSLRDEEDDKVKLMISSTSVKQSRGLTQWLCPDSWLHQRNDSENERKLNCDPALLTLDKPIVRMIAQPIDDWYQFKVELQFRVSFIGGVRCVCWLHRKLFTWTDIDLTVRVRSSSSSRSANSLMTLLMKFLLFFV